MSCGHECRVARHNAAERWLTEARMFEGEASCDQRGMRSWPRQSWARRASGPTATGVRGIATLGGTTSEELAFSVQPRSAVAGQIITPPVQLAALDSLG